MFGRRRATCECTRSFLGGARDAEGCVATEGGQCGFIYCVEVGEGGEREDEQKKVMVRYGPKLHSPE